MQIFLPTLEVSVFEPKSCNSGSFEVAPACEILKTMCCVFPSEIVRKSEEMKLVLLALFYQLIK